MALKYDYDICRAAAGGHQQDAQGGFRAVFRDPATAKALKAAEPGLRAYFEASGFGLDTYDSGAPDDCFPDSDLAARNDITERLAENLSKFDFDDDTASVFSFAEFLDYEFRARPVDLKPGGSAPKSGARGKPFQRGLKAIAARIRIGSAPRVPTLNPLVLGGTALMLFLVPFISHAMGRF